MDSDSYKKSLAEILKDLDPDLLKRFVQDENLSEISLAGKMLWGLIAAGTCNDELCGWAAEVMVQAILSLPEEDSPVQQEVGKRLREGGSAEDIAKEFGENSLKVWPTYTKVMVLAIAKSMQSKQ